MTRSRRNGLIAVLIAAVIAAGVAGLCRALEPLGLRGTHKDWFVQTEAAPLVQFSERIVIAEYRDETMREAPNDPNGDRRSPISFAYLYRRFEVIESIKGDFKPGDTVNVVFSAGHTFAGGPNGELVFKPIETGSPAQGEAQALFLRRSTLKSTHLAIPWDQVWETPEGLNAARIEANGRLSFETTQYYRNALDDMGLKPVPGIGVPFELTIAEVRRLVASDPSEAG